MRSFISRKEMWMPCSAALSALLLPFSCSIPSTFWYRRPVLLKTKPEVCSFALGEVFFSLFFWYPSLGLLIIVGF